VKVTKQSGIRETQFIRVEAKRHHAAPEQVVNVLARNLATIGSRDFLTVREIFDLVRAEAGGFEQLIDLSRHPTPPQSDKEVRR
jgi:hypothetical protein